MHISSITLIRAVDTFTHGLEYGERFFDEPETGTTEIERHSPRHAEFCAPPPSYECAVADAAEERRLLLAPEPTRVELPAHAYMLGLRALHSFG